MVLLWTVPLNSQTLCHLLTLKSGLNCNQQNVVEMMLGDYWGTVRSSVAVSVLVSWNSHAGGGQSSWRCSVTQILPCCEEAKWEKDASSVLTGFRTAPPSQAPSCKKRSHRRRHTQLSHRMTAVQPIADREYERPWTRTTQLSPINS